MVPNLWSASTWGEQHGTKTRWALLALPRARPAAESCAVLQGVQALESSKARDLHSTELCSIPCASAVVIPAGSHSAAEGGSNSSHLIAQRCVRSLQLGCLLLDVAIWWYPKWIPPEPQERKFTSQAFTLTVWLWEHEAWLALGQTNHSAIQNAKYFKRVSNWPKLRPSEDQKCCSDWVFRLSKEAKCF